MMRDVTDAYRVAAILAFVAWPLLWMASLSMYKWALGAEVCGAAWGRSRRFVLSVVLFALGAWVMSWRLDEITPGGMTFEKFASSPNVVDRGMEMPGEVLSALAQLLGAGLTVVIAGVLLAKLYEKWVNGRVSEAERQPGTAGVRAWVGGWNMALGAGLVLCGSAGGVGHLSLAAWVFLVGAVLLAYPVVGMFMSAAEGKETQMGGGTGRRTGEELASERERVLKLLEEGRVTAEEAAELLSALGETLPPAAPSTAEPWTAGRKLVVVGAVVVLIGFFLPWFTFNPADEMRRAFAAGQATLPAGVPRAEMGSMGSVAEGMTVTLSGGDVGRGLGWVILGLALGAAVLPYFATGLNKEQRRGVTLAMLGAGGVVGLYLLTGNLSRVSAGLPVVLVGLAVEAIGVARENVARGRQAVATGELGVV